MQLGLGLALPKMAVEARRAAVQLTPDYTIDFINDVNTGIIACSRGDGTTPLATYWDADGVLQAAAQNVARICYDPKTGAKWGLLVEESRTNSLLYSFRFENAWWSTAGLVTPATAAAFPDGLIPRSITEDTSTGDHLLSSTAVTIAAGNPLVAVFAVKANSRSILRMRIQNADGTNAVDHWFDTTRKIFGLPVAVGSWNISDHEYIEGRDGTIYVYVRFTTATDTSALLKFGPCDVLGSTTYTGDGSSILVGHAELQVNAANFCPSLILTDGATKQRKADRITHSMSPVTGWGGDHGVVSVKYRTTVGNTSRTIIHLGTSGVTANGLAGMSVEANGTGVTTLLRDSTNTNAPTLNARAGIYRGFNTAIMSWKSGEQLITVNGASAFSPQVGTSTTIPPAGGLSNASLGHSITAGTDTSMLCGCIARVDYWTNTLTDAQMRAWSSSGYDYRAIPGPRFVGVNDAGLAFTSNIQPGTLNVDYFDTHQASWDYWHGKLGAASQRVHRLAYRWDRAQQTLGGPLDTDYVNLLKQACDQAHADGDSVFLDAHNFGGYRGQLGATHYVGNSDGVVTIDHLVDFYTRMAQVFADYPGFYGYDIMNEPGNSQTAFSQNWMMQACIDAIRVYDSACYILVEATAAAPAMKYAYQARAMWLNDPADKLIWSAHQYFDSNLSGTYSSSFADDGGYAMRGYDFLVTFAHWCLANNVRGHVGEIGTPGDTDWLTVLDRAAAFLKQANISVSYWQGGRAVSTSDPMRLEPDDLADPVDKPQTAIITAYH